MAAVADRQVLQPPVDREIDQRGSAKDGVGDQIAAEPVEGRADQRTGDDDGETEFRIEILAQVEVAAVTHGTTIDRAAGAHRIGHRQRDVAATPAARDDVGRVARVDGQAGVALRTFREDFHRLQICIW